MVQVFAVVIERNRPVENQKQTVRASAVSASEKGPLVQLFRGHSIMLEGTHHMKKAIVIMALAASLSGCLSLGVTFQRWVGTYEYDGTSYRVALVESLLADGDSRLEYHLVPADTVTYGPQDMIARCVAAEGANLQPVAIERCERPFARAIDALVGPPMMEGDDY